LAAVLAITKRRYSGLDCLGALRLLSWCRKRKVTAIAVWNDRREDLFLRTSFRALSNCSWEDGEVVATFRQPFDLLAQTTAIATRAATSSDSCSAKSKIWLGD
jgi:hypothetical protein